VPKEGLGLPHLGEGKPRGSDLRDDVRLDDAWLKDEFTLDCKEKEFESIAEMGRPKNMDTLVKKKIGKAAADRIEGTHFVWGFAIE
jgi:hypothetical protein